MKFQALSLLLIVALIEVTSADEVSTVPDIGEINDTILHYPSRKDDQLYHNIAVDNYGLALTLLKEFVNSGQSSVVKKIVDQLIEHRRTNVAAFAYKVFEAGLKNVVVDQFPTPYKMVFNGSLIKITNKRYNLPMEYSRFEDRDGDRNVYGKEENAGSNNYVWKLEPVDDGKNVFFKIRHFSNSWYLKLGNDMDSDGDYEAFGSTNSDTERHQWMFQPVMHNDELLFCIINRAHYQALKLGTSVNQGNRRVYSTYGDFYNYPERYGWRIDVITDTNTYGL